MPSNFHWLMKPASPLASPAILPQSSGPFMSASEQDRWKSDAPILVLVPALKISQITSLGAPAKPLTVTSCPGAMLSMSASSVLPTAPLYALMRTFCAPFQIMVNELIGLASLQTKAPDGGAGATQVFATLRPQAW